LLRNVEKVNYKINSRILIEQDKDSIFVAECPSLPGFISQGKTREEVLEDYQNSKKVFFF
jgi:predicted RNase H-like HicB family nuclease